VNPELITKSILMLQTYIRTSIRSAVTLLLLLHTDSLVVLAARCRIILGSSGNVFELLYYQQYLFSHVVLPHQAGLLFIRVIVDTGIVSFMSICLLHTDIFQRIHF
jgi:hypothetical protein